MATGGRINTDILSDEIFDVLCSMCKNDLRNSEGVKFCVECNDYFCLKCANIHSIVPSCTHHKVLDKAQIKSGTSKGLLTAPTVRCDRHSHKHIDMYCQNHDKVGCSTCMVVDHKLCKDTFYIPDYLKNNISKVVQQKIQTDLKDIAKTLTEQSDKYKQDKQKLLKRKAELLADIRIFRQEINDQLDKLEKSSVAVIKDKLKILEAKIEEGLKQLQENKDRVTSALDKITTPNTNQIEDFVYVKMGEEARNVAKTSIEENKMKIKVDSIQFVPNRTLITQLEQRNSLGKIQSLLQINRQKSYNVKIKSDKNECNITSACYMEDGTIILADFNNNNLKRFDCNTYTIIDYCDLPGYPWQVCSINNSQVAVSFLSEVVHFISLDGQMKTTNKINTDFDSYGLAYVNNNLYISDVTSVYIYTLSGRKLKQFSTDESGTCLFSTIYSLAVSNDASRIYVADGNNGLIVLDNNGQVVSTYNGEKLQGALYCHFTEADTVLVSGSTSNIIVQFTFNGDLIGVVVTGEERMNSVRAVCCNEQMSKICFSSTDENHIEVFDI